MPIYIGVSEWSSCSEEVLQALQEHAALKAKEPIDWAHWLQLESGRFGGFDVPYSVGDIVHDLLENFCGHRRMTRAYFVPYMFNYYLVDYPPPREFWFDEVSVQGWQKARLLIIDGVWFHDVWRGIMDDDYRASAQSFARRFNEEYDKIKDQDSWNFEI